MEKKVELKSVGKNVREHMICKRLIIELYDEETLIIK